MYQWFLAKGNGEEGPFTAKQIAAMLNLGEFEADIAQARKEGMSEWLPVSQSGVLAEAAEVPVATIGKPIRRPVITDTPYAPPQSLQIEPAKHRADLELPLEYPGIGRLAYFLWHLGLQVAAYIAIAAILVVMTLANDGKLGNPLLMMMVWMLLATGGSIYIAILRLKNLGMTGWSVLWFFVPVMNLWMGWRLMACPAGYHHHESLDQAGKVISIVMLSFALLCVGLPILLIMGKALFS